MTRGCWPNCIRSAYGALVRQRISYARGFSRWDQYLAMTFAHLTQHDRGIRVHDVLAEISRRGRFYVFECPWGGISGGKGSCGFAGGTRSVSTMAAPQM